MSMATAMESNAKHKPLRVLMLPWLAHGHVSPFFKLAKQLSSSQPNICHVYFCSTPVILASIRSGDDHLYCKQQASGHTIELVELDLPPGDELPPHRHTTKHLPPHLMPALKSAFDLAEPAFDAILADLQPDLLIYDFLQPWAPAAASRRGVPSVLFFPNSAVAVSFLYHHFSKPDERIPFQMYCSSLHSAELVSEQCRRFARSVANGRSDVERVLQCCDQSSSLVLIRTSRDIESDYIDFFTSIIAKEVVPVGLLLQQQQQHKEVATDSLMEWLDGMDKSSVVFVSFGTEYFMSRDEIHETAFGLELSDVPFIWVIRFPTSTDTTTPAPTLIRNAMPSGFLERVKGKVVEGWAPQAAILAHASVGGFVTHCGWSSVLEGMSHGVPMAAMPVHLDQPLNARLVVELGVGVEAKPARIVDGHAEYDREEVARVVRSVMDDEEHAAAVREKAREMGRKMVEKMDEDEEFDAMVTKLSGLCGRYECD